MISSPYLDRRDSVFTWDADPDDATYLKIDLTGLALTTPISVTALAPVVEQTGYVMTISSLTITTTALTFKHTGAGSRVTFRITYGSPSESEDITVRIRAV